MTIRIGTNPIAWSNDDMQDLGGRTPLRTCLAEAREAGYEGIELGHKFPRDAGALTAELAPFRLACVSGWYSSELLLRDAATELRHARPHLDLLKAMGSPVMIVAETSNAIHSDRAIPVSRRPTLRSEEWIRFGARLTEFAEALLSEGVRLVYHHHMGTVVESEADIDALMSRTGEAVHLLLDTGHATWGGADPAVLAARYRDRISHVHTKDIRPDVRREAEANDWSFLDSVLAGVYTVPGDGCIDFVAMFRALRGYSGWVVVEAEQDPAKADPLTYARLGYRNLTGFLAEAGLR
ncbi:myo-inosose-2 dehydratase [Lichenicola cladoniae]|uniref:Myo-inosose-2 dehydratase n=1 Tax=Lichenicola cladoniae TaxID=1484109 RepID=A0A6M8HTZ6_9PROT|nr:myo-inosose-2 dehydratase [Lichenicola cladoniae]NPD66136.1 myo-inosose-2 dehydratase [Acetobacteraceae bacterium]QKE92004.1 myo-inosose-2 dehydratase [Lichenicola cladoniae]